MREEEAPPLLLIVSVRSGDTVLIQALRGESYLNSCNDSNKRSPLSSTTHGAELIEADAERLL